MFSIQLFQCGTFHYYPSQLKRFRNRIPLSPSLRYLIFLLEEVTIFCGLPYSLLLTHLFLRPSFPPLQVTPLRLSVTARPVSSSSHGSDSKGHHGLVASQTARKIMESLGNLSSPLASARKLPMRATSLPGETQVRPI